MTAASNEAGSAAPGADRLAGGVMTLLLILGFLVGTPALGDAQPVDTGLPCPEVGTPAAVATPAVIGTPVADPALETPAAQAGLTVMLLADKTTAGPVVLTVVVRDERCAPVADAAVTVLTRSLVMDHGVKRSEATAAGPGQYVTERVPMGMEGAWQVEVIVSRPDGAAVPFRFVITLEDPS